MPLVIDRMINATEIAWWIGAALSAIALASAIVVPVRKVLKGYTAALDEATKSLEEAKQVIATQCRINDDQDALIERTSVDVSAIKKALLNTNKLDLNRLLDRSIDRGYRMPQESEIAEAIFENYEGLGGNGVTAQKMRDFRRLLVKRKESE